jgi:hypothetical protein
VPTTRKERQLFTDQVHQRNVLTLNYATKTAQIKKVSKKKKYNKIDKFVIKTNQMCQLSDGSVKTVRKRQEKKIPLIEIKKKEKKKANKRGAVDLWSLITPIKSRRGKATGRWQT